MRTPLEFACGGDTLFGTLDTAPGQTGLLIVSGGNEIRTGAWAGQAQLAARVAAAGHPVFRFDRRTHWQHWSDKDRKHYQYGQFLHFSMAGDSGSA